MKRNSTLLISLFIAMTIQLQLPAQCPGGTTAAELNWDHLDFLPSNNTRYTTFYPSAAFPYTQHFAMGTRSLSMAMSPAANITLNGENGLHTGDAGSFATPGDDVQFTTTAASATMINMNFDMDVANVRFSIFDLDNNQRVNITAVNAGGTAQTIVIANASGFSGITLAGSGTTSATATGPGTDYATNSNRGTINVTIAGPVKQLLITMSGAAGDNWLSDINACITGSFPINYQAVSRPFTGQPQYVLTVVNNGIYYVDPTNGRAYFLFREPAHNRLNSMAYDPYRRVVYYTFSLTGGSNPQNDKVLRQYDVDTKTISIVSNNVNDLGIPTYESGVESGAATFYNGSLYLGIEGYTGTTGSSAYAASRKSTIWKIDFDAAGNPIAPAKQVWGVLADNGTNAQNIHDWSDFGISDGMLVDFDGSQSGDIDYYHFNMMTGNTVNYVPSDGIVPRQVSIGWDEKLYNVDASLGLYNGTTATGTRYTISAPLGPVIPTGGSASWGDAAGPYRPFLDFGDAPVTYDPDPWSPACHDTLTPTVASRRTKMILGPDEDVEWLKKGFTTVEDNFEDGLSFVPLFSPPSGTYTARVDVLNNTGSNATVCAWLDFNGNGFFDAAEGITPITVNSSAASQLINLVWPAAPSTLPNGGYTYLRIRITSASYGMTAANSTGYYDMGEVEDYRIVVSYFPLPLTLLSFDAKVAGPSAVELNWSSVEEAGTVGYEIQRSNENGVWEYVSYLNASKTGGVHQYTFTDHQPLKGKSFYRLKLQESGHPDKLSENKMVHLKSPGERFTLAPNPATSVLKISLQLEQSDQLVQVKLISMTGRILYSSHTKMTAGLNNLTIPLENGWSSGTYFVQIVAGNETLSRKLQIRR